MNDYQKHMAQFILGELVEQVLEVEPCFNSPRGSVENRLKLYRQMYIETMLSSLRDTYRSVERFFGEQKFAAWAVRYIHQNPTQSTDLNVYGESYCGFLEKNMPGPARDLARLDWCFYELQNQCDPITTDKKVEIQTEFAVFDFWTDKSSDIEIAREPEVIAFTLNFENIQVGKVCHT